MLLAELSCTILFLLPKGNVDTRGIGIIEVLYKVVEAIIDILINMAVIFYYILHVFYVCRGTETYIMGRKMSQDLESIDQDPLLLLFLDLWKSCYTLYCG